MLDKVQCANHSATHVSSRIVSALNFIQQDFNSRVLWSFPPSPLVSPQRLQSHPARLSVTRTGWTPSSSRAFNLPSYGLPSSAAYLLVCRGESNTSPYGLQASECPGMQHDIAGT